MIPAIPPPAPITQDDAPSAAPSGICRACLYEARQLAYQPSPVHVAGCRLSGPATPAVEPGPRLTGAARCHCQAPAMVVLRLAVHARYGGGVRLNGVCGSDGKVRAEHKAEVARWGTILKEYDATPSA